MERVRVTRARRVPSARRARVVQVVLSVVLLLGGLGGAVAAAWGTGGVRPAGLSVLVTAASFAWALHGPRGTSRPEVVDGATRLPRRRAHVAALVVGCLGIAVSSLCLGLALLDDPDPPRRAGAVWIAIPVFAGYAGWIAVARLLGRGRTTLSPEGLSHTSLVGRTRTLPWRQLHDVRPPTGPGLGLVLETRDGPAAWNINAQGVPAGALASAIRCFAKRPRDRASLAEPGALDRWLDPPPEL